MKRFFKVIAIFMVVILSLGSISLLFDGGSDASGGSGTIVQRPSDKPTDTPNEPQEPDEPNEPQEPDEPDVPEQPSAFSCLNAIDFSDGYDSCGFSINSNAKGVGEFIFDENSMKFVIDPGEKNPGSSLIHFFAYNSSISGNTKTLSMESFDYLMFDFDIFTDDKYITPIKFYITDGSNPIQVLKLERDEKGNDKFTYEGYNQVATDHHPNKATHLTFIVANEGNSCGTIYFFIDGEFKAKFENCLSNFDRILGMRLLFDGSYYSVSETASVTFKDIKVHKFGDGDKNYNGSLKDILTEDGNLMDCPDSVIYGQQENYSPEECTLDLQEGGLCKCAGTYDSDTRPVPLPT